jgi:hypothetical protein
MEIIEPSNSIKEEGSKPDGLSSYLKVHKNDLLELM